MSSAIFKQGGLHASVVRRINSIRVFHALRLNPGISQREVAARTGVDKSTISAIVNYFDSLRLIERQQDSEKRGPGRPSESIQLLGGAGLLLGIHIEPEQLKFVLSGIDGVPIGSITIGTPASFNDVSEALGAGLQETLARAGRQRSEVRSVGVCVPGLVTSRGRLAQSPNMKWHDLDVRELLSAALGGNVIVGNESRAAGLAEKLFGRCIDLEDFIFLDSGSGVGGGLFLDGRIYRGTGGFAGEIGHVKVVPHGRLCDCGATGCLSAYLSEPSLRQRFIQRSRSAHSFEEMGRLASAGDPVAVEILDEAGEMLGIALADLVNLFNPAIIVLGGGLAILSEHLLDSARRALSRHALEASSDLADILVSELARESVPRSGIALALDGLATPVLEGSFPW